MRMRERDRDFSRLLRARVNVVASLGTRRARADAVLSGTRDAKRMEQFGATRGQGPVSRRGTVFEVGLAMQPDIPLQ